MSPQPSIRGTAGELLQHPWILQNTLDIGVSVGVQSSKAWTQTQVPNKAVPHSPAISQYRKPGIQNWTNERAAWEGRSHSQVVPKHRNAAKLTVPDTRLTSKPQQVQHTDLNLSQVKLLTRSTTADVSKHISHIMILQASTRGHLMLGRTSVKPA